MLQDYSLVNLPIIKAGIKRILIARECAFGQADSERRAITLEDLEEGYALADKFMGKQPQVSQSLQRDWLLL